MPTLPLATLAAFVSAVDELVPDMKGAYDETGFVEQGAARLSDDVPAVEAVDVGGSFFDPAFFTEAFFESEGTDYLLPGPWPFFERWIAGFSDRWPLEIEQLTTGGKPFSLPEEYVGAWRIESRWYRDALATFLVFTDAPASTAKARVRFRRPWRVTASVVEVPRHLQMAVVYWACSLKCDALAAFYRSSIDPAGGSDIFDARQYADSYETKAEKFRERFADLSGVGGDEPSFSTGAIRTGEPTIFDRGHDTGLLG